MTLGISICLYLISVTENKTYQALTTPVKTLCLLFKHVILNIKQPTIDSTS